MKFHVLFLLAIIVLAGNYLTVSAQVNNLAQSQIDSVIGQVTNSSLESFAGGISGDGRFVVFESTANLATENPRNTDGNREVFLFDYAQRRIFQITDTTSLRNDPTMGYSSSNTKVLITNVRPVISNDGRWIAFGSNATTSTPTTPNTTNPGSFNAESFNPVSPATTPENPLVTDGNTEMWLYQIPATTFVNLSAGDEITFTNLNGGTFTRVTNSLPSRLPFPGSTTAAPVIADDNRDASINDNGNYIAFTSNRDLVTGGNASPNANDEIFTYARNLAAVKQVTQTNRGTILDPIVNITPTISGNGLRVALQSNADKPIIGMTTGSNTDKNFEVFYTDLDATGAPSANRTQVTTTARTNLGDIVNVLDFGRRMSRDGRYIALDSYADLASENSGTNYTSFALYVYDTQVANAPPTNPPTSPFRRIGPRSDADASASGGDVAHYGGFTDTNASGTPATLVFETRANIIADGTVSATNDAGLNSNTDRPSQIYAYPLDVAAMAATFKRLTKFPSPNSFIAATQPIPSNSVRRMTFNLALTEIGTGNSPDLNSEAYYFLLPTATAQSRVRLNTFTGASRQIVSASPVPTPTATATPTPSPTPTPTPSPTPTPTTTPSPTPTPTPQTPSAVQGVSPGMLVTLEYDTGINNVVTARTAVGSISRRLTLPIELSGVTLTVNGAAAGLKSVSQRQITFVVPPALGSGVAGTSYPLVVNSNGVVFRSTIVIVPVRPDVFTTLAVPAPNGRARIFNITNPVFIPEPFTVTTLRYRGGRRVPTVVRLFLTGVEGVPADLISVRVRDPQSIRPTTGAILREPGVYSIDFTLPATLLGAGDVPVIVTVTVSGTTFQSRLDDTAPVFRIL